MKYLFKGGGTNMYFGIPQILYLVLTIVGLVLSGVDHGKTKNKKENFWVSLVSTTILCGILYWGGFFN